MDGRIVRRTALVGLLLFLLYVLAFTGYEEEQRSPPTRDLKNAPLDDLVWRYIYGVRSCLRDRTDVLEMRPQPFSEYWRNLPVVADECSVNAQMSVKTYPVQQKFDFFFVPNMNRSLEKEKCLVVSFVGEDFPEVATKFKRENPSCRYLEYSPVGQGDRVEDVVQRLKALPRVHSLFISPSSVDAHSVIDLLSSDSPLPTAVCQVNLLYPEPTVRLEGQFVADFNRLLTDGRYVLLRAEKDFSSTRMNLFFVNFQDDYCRKRYFRMYTFD